MSDREGELAITVPRHAGSWSWLDRRLRQGFLARLRGLRQGGVLLHDALGSVRLGQASPGAQAIEVRVDAPAFYRMVALNGSVGAGEAWIEGLWRCSDLVGLMRLLLRNRDLLDGMETGSARLGSALLRGWHALRRNNRAGSRRNIAAHYDLGNDFFALFLDSRLMYSSAIFADPAESLEQASLRKIERICTRLQLAPDDRVIEIGGGWGGFAVHAARYYGCHVTTATISRAQYEYARAKVAAEGLQDRVEVLLQDYRELTGRFDKLVSIEMVEAVGHQYLGTYLARCASLLEPHGLALIQAITIEDHRYRRALREVDFIKRHVFPGSFIPSVAAIAAGLARHTDLRPLELVDIGPSYALTLRHWRERFMARRAQARALGYGEDFLRLWEFYLCYCEAGFHERAIGDVQLLLARPGARRPQAEPPLSGT